MTSSKDWLPSTKTGQLEMAKRWVEVLSARASLWNIPEDALTNFKNVVKTAENAFDVVQNKATNTTVAKTKYAEAISLMQSSAREMKRWFFHSPPLKDHEMVMLGLKPRDRVHTPTGTPTAQAIAETFLKGVAEMGITVAYRTGNAEDPANKVFRVHYVVRAANEKAPQNPDEFTKSFPAKRRETVIQFDYSDSGKICYFIVQIENGKKKGPWGAISSAMIP